MGEPRTGAGAEATGSRSGPEGVTELIRAWSRGESAGDPELQRLVYAELHRIAQRTFRSESEGHTLQPTALVHEAYLRLAEQRKVDWRSRDQFFALAARMMRRILVDHARGRRRVKRGGDRRRVPLEEIAALAMEWPPQLLDLDQALSALARVDPTKAMVVELRVFGGLSVRETAELLDLSEPTVGRHWRFARAWLYRELDGAAEATSEASSRSSSSERSRASSGRPDES